MSLFRWQFTLFSKFRNFRWRYFLAPFELGKA